MLLVLLVEIPDEAPSGVPEASVAPAIFAEAPP